MNTKWKDQFHFTRSERNGALLLSVLILLVFILPHVYSLFAQPKVVDFSEFETTLNEFYNAEEIAEAKTKHGKTSSSYNTVKTTTQESSVELFSFNPNTATSDQLRALGLSAKTANILLKYRNKGGKFYKKEDLKKIYGLKAEDYDRLEDYIEIPKTKTNSNPNSKNKFNNENSKSQNTDVVTQQPKPIALFDFDPNTTSIDDFVKLGLSPKTAATVVKYREKGGTFYKKEDFKKIYGLKDNDYTRLENYINIPNSNSNSNSKTNSNSNSKDKFKKETAKPKFQKPKPQAKIDINTASAENWQELRGIGPSYSSRIVKFRESLGGFHRIDQISEVYGLPDSTFQAIQPYLQLGSSPIRKLNINTATVDDFKAHPYLKWKQANVIINYREQHGAFQSVNDLSKVKVIPPETLAKLTPYLTVE